MFKTHLSADISHYMSGKFHFVDLAGSERAHKTGNIGDRFKGTSTSGCVLKSKI